MYYIFDDDSGKYLHITREQLTQRGKTIIKVSKVERKADATAYGSHEAARDIIKELNESGAGETMSLMVMCCLRYPKHLDDDGAFELAQKWKLVHTREGFEKIREFWRHLAEED